MSDSGIAAIESFGRHSDQELAATLKPRSPDSSRSRSASRDNSRSRSPSPARSVRSRSPSPAGSLRSRSPSSARSVRSRSPSPAGSLRSRSPSPAGSLRSRSPSSEKAAIPNGARSRSASPDNQNSRSGSPKESRSRSASADKRSVSPGSPRSRSISPDDSKRALRYADSSASSSARSSPDRNTSFINDAVRTQSPVSPLEQSDDEGEDVTQSKRILLLSEDEEDHGRVGEEGVSDREHSPAPVKRSRRRMSSQSSHSGQEEEEDREPAQDRDNEKGREQEERADDRDSGEEDAKDAIKNTSGLCDFDLMMETKRAENRANRQTRRRKDIELINDNDDAIARLIADMRQAARDDRELNEARRPATKKMAMMVNVMQKLGKVDLQMAFVEANVLSVMTDWLAPLPYDKSLPHVQIRSEFLKYLKNIPIDDYSRLKESGIGKAVMYLYRHPKETRPNKNLSGIIINKWSRPIFNLSADFSAMSKEDRERRDLEMASKLNLNRRKRPAEESSADPLGLGGSKEHQTLRPGDPGWVNRARVPMPDTREFVQRPQWQSHEDLTKSEKKEMTKLEKHKRQFADRRKARRIQHAIKISLEGKHMKL